MILLKISMILLLLGVIPILLGELITCQDTADLVKSTVVKYMMGLFLSLSLFWILCLPMTFLKVSFTILTVIYSCCLLVLTGIAIWVCHRRTGRAWIGEWKPIRLKGCEMVFLLIFLALLGIQLYFAAFYEATVWSYDDATYVVQSLDTISSDHMYLTDKVTGELTGFNFKRVLNSWQIYIAYLSKMSGFHVTTIAHTIIPVVFLLIAYGVYGYMASCIFKERENQLAFLSVLSAVFIFGFYSPYSLTFRLLVTLWQGKAVLSAIVLPFLFTFLPKVYEQKYCLQTVSYLLLISMTACSLTMMGAGMSIAVYAGMWLVFVIYRRRFSGVMYCFWGCIVPAMQMVLYLILR